MFVACALILTYVKRQAAESIFNNVIGYGIALYLKPVFEVEEVKARNLSIEARKLQTIQNKMIRMIFGFRVEDKVNMEELREKIGMLSVNQMNCYHVLLEAFNVIRNGSSVKIQDKWKKTSNQYSNRRLNDVKVPKVNHTRCEGFSFYGAKFWNSLPEDLKAITSPDTFKVKVKEFILETIPSF